MADMREFFREELDRIGERYPVTIREIAVGRAELRAHDEEVINATRREIARQLHAHIKDISRMYGLGDPQVSELVMVAQWIDPGHPREEL